MTTDTTTPLVTIGIPVYNGENFLEHALRSAADQKDVNLEIVVCNNGSTDGTKDILDRFAATEPRLRVFHSDENHGAAFSFNKCVEMATGQYFRWAAHDDVFDPMFTKACLDEFEREPSLSAVVTKANMIDDDGEIVTPLEDFWGCQQDDPLSRGADIMLDSRWCLHVFGLIPTAMLRETRLIQAFTSSDHVTLFELALRGKYALVDERWFGNREHADRSVRAHGRNSRDREAWFDPNREGKFTLPKWRLLRAYWRGYNEWAGVGVQTLKFVPLSLRWMGSSHNRRILVLELLGWMRFQVRSRLG